MVSEAETIIAFVFKKNGKKELPSSLFYLTLSMDLNWFTPNDAKKFMQHAIKQKLLIKEDDLLTPTFNIGEIEIPLGFVPSKKTIPEEELKEKTEEDVLTKIIKKITKETNISSEELLKKVSTIEKEKNINPEVAALLIGKEKHIELSEFLDEVKEKIFEK